MKKRPAHQTGIADVPNENRVPSPPIDHRHDPRQLDADAEAKAKAKAKAKEIKLHSIDRPTVPRKLPTGEVLVHNHVKPAAPLGWNGFRAWTQEPDDTLEPCTCKMGGTNPHNHAHYRIKRSIITARDAKITSA
jgi:hypothetical protein